MNKEFNIYEEIDLYLQGKLSREALTAFEHRLSTDAAFAEEVELQKTANEYVLDREMISLQDQMSQDLKNWDENSGGRLWNKLWITGILFVSVATGLYYFLSSNTKTTTPIVVSKESVPNTASQTPAPVINSRPAAIREKKQEPVTQQNIVVSPSSTNPSPVFIPLPETPKEVVIPAPVNPTQPQPEDVYFIDCSRIKYTARVSITSSCENNPTGKIIVDQLITQGGEPPYTYSLNHSSFQKEKDFVFLAPGSYQLIIKDKNKCETVVYPIYTVESLNCNTVKSYSFNSSQGEVWKHQTNVDRDAVLHIFSEQNAEVFSMNLSAGSMIEWDGRNNAGAYLPAGSYQFIIEYDNGKVEKGFISIMK